MRITMTPCKILNILKYWKIICNGRAVKKSKETNSDNQKAQKFSNKI
jgi:hypothetical protein